MSEFDLIARLRDRLGGIGAARIDLGIGDDAALWTPQPGHQIVTCCDTLIEGRHFPADADPADIAWKALAVNLSDLAAMGAEPVAALLALSLPALPEAAWLERFCEGWAALAQAHGVALAGGDTTRGPVLALTVTCLGEVPSNTALRRDGAQPGDGLYVSGTLGDAAAGLRAWSRREQPGIATLVERLNRPSPRLMLGRALRGMAHAAIDVSDGLLADLGHVLAASGVGAELDASRLPLSSALRELHDADDAMRLALTGGDDYELCFTVSPPRERDLCAVAKACDIRLSRIGDIVSGGSLRIRDADGRPVAVDAAGWDHFAASTGNGDLA